MSGMHRQFASLVFLAALAVVGVASAQPSLPPEARARVLILDIDKALGREDEAAALAKLRELDSVGVSRPVSLYITEAKLAGRAKDYERARLALEKYFKAASSTDPAYDEAVSIYSALGEIFADMEAQAAAERAEKEKQAALKRLEAQASDLTAWQAADAAATCESYRKYLTSNAGQRFRDADAMTAGRSMGCAFANFTGRPVSFVRPVPGHVVRELASLVTIEWTISPGAESYILEIDNGDGQVQVPVSENEYEHLVFADGRVVRFRVTPVGVGGLRGSPSEWHVIRTPDCANVLKPDLRCKR